MKPSANDNIPMEERVDRALVVLAYLIEIEGDFHVPMYEIFEAKLAEIRSQSDAKSRAASRLQAFMARGATLGITPPALKIAAA